MLPLASQVFTILAGLIEERGGLQYRLDDLELLRDKVSPRAEQLGFESLLDYYYYLRYDPNGPAELDALLEFLVVHETYFFREVDQLEALVRDLLPPLLAQRERVRIWCAALRTNSPYARSRLYSRVTSSTRSTESSSMIGGTATIRSVRPSSSA